MFFQFNSKNSKLAELNPKITFKGSEKLDLNSEFSPITYNLYDFILDLNLNEMDNVSIKLKSGSYFGYFELNNNKVQPLWVSRFSIQKIYFGYDPSKYNALSNQNVEFYKDNKCKKNSFNHLICPKIEIEAGKKYYVQLQIEEEVFDGKSTAILWLGTPFLPAVTLGFIPPNILLGTMVYKQEINVKVNQKK
ncbi:MAG: hypothetical protein SFU98_20545 [Leptospiraceae bacterium]|nr:hypothetical protein [Leptospiraceae bacterium]